MLQFKGPFEPGTWRYNISVAREFVGQTAMIVVHLNVKNEVVVQGFLDSQASMGSVNGSSVKALKAFAYVEKLLENAFEISCKPLMHQDDNQQISQVHLKDNGLTSKRKNTQFNLDLPVIEDNARLARDSRLACFAIDDDARFAMDSFLQLMRVCN